MMPTGDEADYHWEDSGQVIDYNPWLDANVTVCEPLTVTGEAEIIITDFHAG
jgi:hypothetical protein